MRNRDELRRLQMDANTAKDRLWHVSMELEEAGFIRQSRALMTIIYKLEEWQNKE